MDKNFVRIRTDLGRNFVPNSFGQPPNLLPYFPGSSTSPLSSSAWPATLSRKSRLPFPMLQYAPSDVEAKYFLYGLPSMGRLIARSSTDVWMRPTGPEAYLDPKELAPLGVHQLNSELWEGTVAPAMDQCLLEQDVQCTFLNPVRIGVAGQDSFPIVLIGVIPGALSSEAGLPLVTACHSILVANGISDMHVILYESQYRPSARLYKPAITSNPADILRDPFSTTLGIPICSASATYSEGTAGFFIDSSKPGIIYLLIARHVLFHPDREENELYTFREGTGKAKRKVMLMGEAAFKARCEAVESAIGGKEFVLGHFKDRLEEAREMEETDEKGDPAAAIRAEAEREIVKWRRRS